MKKKLKQIIVWLLANLPKGVYDCFIGCFSKDIYNKTLERRIKKFGNTLANNPDKCYKKIRKFHRIMIIEEGSYPYTYFNICYLNNILNLILYSLYEGCIPVIRINEGKANQNQWAWYFKQPFEILTGQRDILEKYTIIKCPIKDSLFRCSFEEGFYPYSENFPIWSSLYKKFVVFNDQVERYINKEKSELLKEKTLGVLIRGTDYTALKPHGHPIQPELEDIMKYVKKWMYEKEYKNIYVATEEKRLFDEVVECFGSDNVLSNRRTYYDEAYYSKGHQWIGEISFGRENDEFLKGLEYLSSLSILSSCQGLVAGNCGGSLYAMLLAEKYEDIKVFNKGYY